MDGRYRCLGGERFLDTEMTTPAQPGGQRSIVSRAAGLCWTAIAMCALPFSAARADADMGLPNLRPIGPIHVGVGPNADGPGNVLEIVTRVENLGPAPLELRAGQPGLDSNMDSMKAEQCVAWQGVACTEWAPAGNLVPVEFDCWSLDSAMRYELRLFGPDGQPRDDGILQSASAARFFRDDSPDSDHPANENVSISSYKACLGFVRQGLSAGWVAVWTGDLPGQTLSLDGVADGLYALVVTADPSGALREADKADNSILVKVRIFGGGTKAEVIP